MSTDAVAIFALGNLARSQGDPTNEHDQHSCPHESGNLNRNQGDLLKNCHDHHNCRQKFVIQSFWAPFLLLHLGGPDTITAYSFEDNKFWLRHVLNLIVQVVVVFYVFIRSRARDRLTIVAIPVFVAAVIKYVERCVAMRSVTTDGIKETLSSILPEGNEVMVVPRPSSIPMNNYLQQAYYLFGMSLFLFMDFSLGLTELNDSYTIISSVKTSNEAFKLIEVELGFIYDLFYTKLITVHSRRGKNLRLITFLSTVSALVAFACFIGKGCSYCLIDVQVTYLLLIGALALELYSFGYLIFTDWTINWYFNPAVRSISGAIYSLHSYFFDGKRWSGNIAQYSLIRSCLKKDNLPQCLMFDVMEEMMIDSKEVDQEMKDLIFKQLLEKGNQIFHNLRDTKLRKKLVDQKADGILERMSRDFQNTVQFRNLANDIRRISELEFYHSVLIWHIATSLCYHGDDNSTNGKNLSTEPRFSKCLSDYMMYLLVLRPSMLPKGTGDIDSVRRDACEDVRSFFKYEKPPSEMDACQDLLRTDTIVMERRIANANPSVFVEKTSSKYKLVDGCELARKLKSLPTEKMWKIICEVWIEMLAYAASHCGWREHAGWKEHTIQLRRGGELLTHVCLLMAHLGLSQQYQEISIDERRDVEII